jgi:hypothetical protein
VIDARWRIAWAAIRHGQAIGRQGLAAASAGTQLLYQRTQFCDCLVESLLRPWNAKLSLMLQQLY